MSRIFDTHFHVLNFDKPDQKTALLGMDKYHVDRLAMLAEEPIYTLKSYRDIREHNKGRMDRLFQWCDGSDGRLLPIWWVNTTDPDAMQQVDEALDRGAVGFKVINETTMPGDGHALDVYRRMADAGKSILFHTGICWDWADMGNFNRPCNWECMMNVENAKFAAGHVSWPWTDECLAVYGKFSSLQWHPMYRGQEMYLDLTPGTPDNYRQKVLNTYYDVCYDGMNEHLLFGTDFGTEIFHDGPDAAKRIVDRAKLDTERLLKAGFTQETVDKILYQNSMDFWGLKD